MISRGAVAWFPFFGKPRIPISMQSADTPTWTSVIDDELTPIERNVLAAYRSPAAGDLRRQIRLSAQYALCTGLFVYLSLSSGQPLYGLVVYAVFLLWCRTLPANRGRESKLRTLDCPVVNDCLGRLATRGQVYDTVRAAFWEGDPIYPGAGFARESHIQVVVRNPACILGVFRPNLTL